MRKFLVIGIYEDDYQRFADEYWAKTPEQAEQMSKADHPGLIVAGVINSQGEVVA